MTQQHIAICVTRLGTGNDAVVLQIGAVKFDAFRILEQQQWVVDVGLQVNQGRDINSDMFYKFVDNIARVKISPYPRNRTSGFNAVHELDQFVKPVDDVETNLWFLHPDDDVALLESFTAPKLFKGRTIRDVKAFSKTGEFTASVELTTTESALVLAANVAISIQSLLFRQKVEDK